jgi:phosphoribosylglycinamide formyltransferase 1
VSSSKADGSARLPVVVLLSGTGTNFSAIAAAARAGQLPIDIRAVLSDRPAAQGLERARALGIPAEAVAFQEYTDRAAHGVALAARIDAYEPALVICAGYMRIFTEPFVTRYAGRMLNIHPSLLPAFKGLDTHERALAAGVHEHGCSVHFVTYDLDGGPLIAQAPVPIMPGDTADSLADRVHRAEHQIYPLVIGWYAAGRLGSEGTLATLDGLPLHQPIRLENLHVAR